MDTLVFSIFLILTAALSAILFRASMADENDLEVQPPEVIARAMGWRKLMGSESILLILAISICVAIVSLA